LKKQVAKLVKMFTMLQMDKQKAIDLLGGSPKKAAEAMGYTSVHAVYMWPDHLPKSIADRVLGILSRIHQSHQAEQAVA